MSEEPDYLARAQPDFDPFELRHVVKDVFAFEFGVTKGKDIARIVGKDESRISQIFGDPAKVKPETIEWLIAVVKSPRNRERIVEAWSRAHSPDVGSKSARGREVGERVTVATRKRIDRLIRLEKLPLAARISYQAALKAEEGDLRETLLDRAYFLHQRLDRPGLAMSVARHVAIGARKRGEPHREAAAHFMRGRILVGLADTPEDHVLTLIDDAEALVRGLEVSGAREYMTVDSAMIASFRESVSIEYMVRALRPVDEDFVRSVRDRHVAEAKGSKKYQRKFSCYVMAARCSLLLGDTFGAEEMLENAYRSGYEKNLHLAPVTSYMRSKIMEATATSEARAAYLLEVVGMCGASMDLYHLRLAEWDLARVQAGRFPRVSRLD